MYKFLDEWKEVKGEFIKPSFKWYFGPWRKYAYGNLNGPCIWLSHNYRDYYRAYNSVLIKNGTKKWKFDDKEYESPVYVDGPKHTLPGGLREGQFVWRRDIRKKLRRWGLGWLRPLFFLPRWLTFRWINADIGWKTKWDEYRYEWPARKGIVLFGFAIIKTAYIPKENEKDWTCNDDYWESLLTYKSVGGDLKKTNDAMGAWVDTEGNREIRFQTRFLADPEKRKELIEIQKKQHKKHKKKTK